MAALGNIGCEVPRFRAFQCRGVFTLKKQPTSVDATSAGGTASAIVHLFLPSGFRVDSARANSSGVWHFYDLDDGTYFASEVGTANAWEIEVSGATATVTALSGGGASGTVSHGWVG